MLHRRITTYLRRHHLGLIAIFIALSGTAYAATAVKNSVTSKSIKNGAVTLRDLGANSVDSSKVVDNSLTGADILESSLSGLAGPAGAQGERGLQGEQGIQGPVGPSTGPAGGDLAGNYPNPTIGSGKVTPDKIGVIPAARASIPCLAGVEQQISGDGSLTPLSFNAENFDTANVHNQTCDALASRMTAPQAGIYQVSASVAWNTNATGSRFLGIRRNGSNSDFLAAQRIPALAAGDVPENSVSTLVRLEVGGYVEAVVSQNSTTSITLNTVPERGQLSMNWVAPL